MVFLPMIDFSPSDPSRIFSTMLFVSDQGLQHKKTAIPTFDQPGPIVLEGQRQRNSQTVI